MFNKKSEKKYSFPKEESFGNIAVEGDRIICKGKDAIHNCEINIKDIQYVYIIVNAQGESSLFIFDYHQNRIPTHYTGFSKAYNLLSARFNFNDEVFFESIYQDGPVKKQIWRKIHAPTYQILSENNKDYESGFEIQSPKKEFISWDATYQELGQCSNVFFEKSPYGQKLLTFKFPVRVGNLLLNDFNAYFDSKRSDVAVQHFYTHCIDKTNSGKSYFELKERLQKDFLEENQLFQYERADQNSFSFNAKGMSVSLVYTYDNSWQFDGGYTSFNIQNRREYPELLINTEYENKMEVSNYITINKEINTPSDYKKNKFIKFRPLNLLSGSNAPTVWMDNKNSKIGFADKTYCLIFDKKDIISFTIQNILPAKGSGGSYLMLNLKDNNSISVFSGACNVFNAFNEKISNLTGLEVNMAPEYHDC